MPIIYIISKPLVSTFTFVIKLIWKFNKSVYTKYTFKSVIHMQLLQGHLNILRLLPS